MKKTISFVTCISVFLSSFPSQAYNRSTHQHITELAYGLIKYAEYCQVSQDTGALIAVCQADCVNRVKPAGNGTVQEAQLTQCRAECEADGRDGHIFPVSILAAGNQAGDPNESRDAASRFCTHFDPIIRTYKTPQGASKIKAYKETSSASYFYQTFKSKACPDKWVYDYKLDQGCASYEASDQNALGYGNKFDELRNFTRSQHGNKIVYAFDDDFLQNEKEKNPGNYYEYLPVRSNLLNLTNVWINKEGKTRIDLTGSILGYHAGATDLFHDIYTSLKILPIVEDVTKTVVQGAAVVVGGVVVAVWAIGVVVVCGIKTLWNEIFGDEGDDDDCFSKSWSDIADYIGDIGDAVKDVEEKNLFGVLNNTTTAGRDNTSFFHFMNTTLDWQSLTGLISNAHPLNALELFGILGTLFWHDDVDGYRPGEAFGIGGGLVAGLWENSNIDQLLDVRVSFAESKPALLNYQVMEPDDGMEASSDWLGDPLREVFYWHRQGFFDYTFPPVDNLAYYWWHKWWEARVAGQAQTEALGLVPLGAVMHAVQDITQPLHARGLTLHGHADYESDIENRMDRVMYYLRNERRNAKPILDLENDVAEINFVSAVAGAFSRLHEQSIDPVTGVLHVRRLMHTLYMISSLENDDSWFNFDFSSWVGFFDTIFSLTAKNNISAHYTANTGLVYATAATMLVLMEGAREDVAAYQTGLNLGTFENFTHGNGKFFKGPDGSYNRLETYRQPLTGSVSYIDNPDQLPEEWACAGSLPEVQEAVRAFIEDKLIARDMIEVVMAGQLKCEIMGVGLPMPPAPDIARLAKYKARQLEHSIKLMSSGDVDRYNQEMACAQVEAWDSEQPAAGQDRSVVVPAKVYARAQARCGLTSDADADGVPDHLDECVTPPQLLKKPGRVVQANGCVFNHSYKTGERLPERFVPGMRFEQRRNP